MSGLDLRSAAGPADEERRRLLGLAIVGAGAALAGTAADAHTPTGSTGSTSSTGSSSAATGTTPPPLGWVKPRAEPPAWRLTLADGSPAELPQLLGRGRLCAVQMMFTGCTTTCSAQGLLFATLAAAWPAQHRALPVQWLSISIDALGDDAARLRDWQRRYGAVPPAWQAAVPGHREVDALSAFLRGVPGRQGTHTDQVFVFDRAGRLAYRTGDRPEPHFLEQLLLALA